MNPVLARDDGAPYCSITVREPRRNGVLPHELFFVKNLEPVQSDERDAIILTIGYGKDPTGRLLYRFGPLNHRGGEQHLNVAVTRARRRMTLARIMRHRTDPKHTVADSGT